jgi:hypothetical protein
MVQKRPSRLWRVPPLIFKKVHFLRNIHEKWFKKRSHATIKNPNQVYGNNHHVKGSIKKRKNYLKTIMIHAYGKRSK